MNKQKPGEDNCNIYNVQRLNNNNKKKAHQVNKKNADIPILKWAKSWREV